MQNKNLTWKEETYNWLIGNTSFVRGVTDFVITLIMCLFFALFMIGVREGLIKSYFEILVLMILLIILALFWSSKVSTNNGFYTIVWITFAAWSFVWIGNGSYSFPFSYAWIFLLLLMIPPFFKFSLFLHSKSNKVERRLKK